MEVLMKDVTYLLNITQMIDQMYASNDNETYYYLKHLRKIVDNFNEKYPGIHVAVSKTFLKIYLKFFVRKSSINDVFSEFMTNHSSIKNRIFSNSAKVSVEFIEKSEHTYGDKIEDTLALKKDTYREMVELIYMNDTLNNPASHEFKLIAFHALDTYNKKIDIQKDDIFCFDFDEGSGGGLLYLPRKFLGEATH